MNEQYMIKIVTISKEKYAHHLQKKRKKDEQMEMY
jgi:hypothetical protein